jgi:hypothetical protein
MEGAPSASLMKVIATMPSVIAATRSTPVAKTD